MFQPCRNMGLIRTTPHVSLPDHFGLVPLLLMMVRQLTILGIEPGAPRHILGPIVRHCAYLRYLRYPCESNRGPPMPP